MKITNRIVCYMFVITLYGAILAILPRIGYAQEPSAAVPDNAPYQQPPDGTGQIERKAYPSDPSADVKWPYNSDSTVADIQRVFNTARSSDSTVSVQIIMPSQTEWNAKSDGEKALWLINKERVDRGIAPLHGVETNVTGVAQTYAQYLLDHNAFSHDADGRTPWERLNANPAIGACHDFLNVAENLAVLWGGWTLPIERSVYMWMYDDSSSSWGHRHAILWYPYNDNSGPVGQEGFLGIGRVTGTHQGYSNSDIVVMNVFDPCATWIYSVSETFNYILWTR